MKNRSYDPYIMEERITALENAGSTPAPEPTSWDYSTTETDTKQKWIDGKEIYCKVVAPATPVSYTKQTWAEIGTLEGVEAIIKTNVIYIYSTTNCGEGGFLTDLNKTTNKLSVYHDAYNGTIVAMVVFYTKAAAPSKSRKR